MHARSIPRLALWLLTLIAAPLHATVQPGDPIGSFDITRFEVTGDSLLGAAAVQAASWLKGWLLEGTLVRV